MKKEKGEVSEAFFVSMVLLILLGIPTLYYLIFGTYTFEHRQEVEKIYYQGINEGVRSDFSFLYKDGKVIKIKEMEEYRIYYVEIEIIVDVKENEKNWYEVKIDQKFGLLTSEENNYKRIHVKSLDDIENVSSISRM